MLEATELQRLTRATPGLFALLLPNADFTVIAASADYLQAAHADESILGRPLFDVFPDNLALADAQGALSLRASLERVVASRLPDQMGVTRYDIQLPASSGAAFHERYWLPINVPVLGDSGEVLYIVHRVEEAAAKGNSNAIAILESISEGFFTLDRQWQFDYVNAEAHRILGVARGSLTGRVIWDVYPGLEDTPFWEAYHATMTSRVKTSFSAHYEQQARWYDVTVFPAPEGISVYFRDVTQNKISQTHREALADLSQLLGNAADAGQAAYEGARLIGTTLQVSRVGYGTVDHDSGHLFVDKDWTQQGASSLSGVTPLTAYGTFIDGLRRAEFIAIGDVRHDARTVEAAAALEAKQARSFVNYPVLERGRLVAVVFVNDNKPRDWTSLQLEFIKEAAARIRASVERTTAELVLRASEERYRLLSAELGDAGRMKDEFLATLAHELRNPLAPIRNALKIQSLSDDPGVIARTRELMERQVVHMVRLIDDLLDLSRLSRGLIDLKPERVALASSIALAVEASRPAIERASHELSVTVPGEDLAVFADPVRMTQIITNLLNNAAKFTPSGGKLGLALKRDGEDALLLVSDNGIGMRQDMLERVFNMFEQVDRSNAQDTGGLGIGLTLVRRLVEAQGGSVRAQSAGLGQGSMFSVRLPLCCAVATAAPAAEDSPPASPSPLRILVADDNEDAASSLSMFLRMSGHETRVASNGAQALAVAEEFHPDVAVLDIAMPILDGLEVARRIRAGPMGGEMLLLALSGFGQSSDKQRSAAAGFDAHLVKPIDLTEISDILQRHAVLVTSD